MAHTTKGRGLTISDAYAKRGGALPARVSGVVAAVADPETASVQPSHIEVPSGTVRAVVAWIGDDRDRAAAAADDPRKGVRDAAAAILGG